MYREQMCCKLTDIGSGELGKGLVRFNIQKMKSTHYGEKTTPRELYIPTSDFRKTRISSLDDFTNFEYLTENVRKDEPFLFWYWGSEPHRKFEKDSWKQMGKKLKDVDVLDFLPDTEEVRSNLLDYAVEIE